MSELLNKQLDEELKKLHEAGTYKHMKYLDSPMDAAVEMEERGRVMVFSSNNYLGLANTPAVKEAGAQALEKWGAGTASVRFICGTFTVHRMLEKELAGFVGCEAALSYVSCWCANEGLIPTLAGPDDVIFSDALNHASIIDACRLAKKTDRRVFQHKDTGDLEGQLKETQHKRRRFIITDGVFSMEGDVAPLDALVELSRNYDAVLIVDDSHGTGVLGEHGRGTAEYFKVLGKVDIITSTLGKALGGAAGGFVAASRQVIDYLVQVSRPQLFSNALPPTVAASALKALQVVKQDPALVKKLHDNVAFMRTLLADRGFSMLESPTAIIPIIIGDTAKAIAMSDALLKRGIFVTGFGFPVVPKGTARLRIQISAAHTSDELSALADALVEVRNEGGG